MPSQSMRQHVTMAMAAHDPAFAKRMGIPQSVAREFVAADKRAGKHQGKGRGKSAPKTRRSS